MSYKLQPLEHDIRESTTLLCVSVLFYLPSIANVRCENHLLSVCQLLLGAISPVVAGYKLHSSRVLHNSKVCCSPSFSWIPLCYLKDKIFLHIVLLIFTMPCPCLYQHALKQHTGRYEGEEHTKQFRWLCYYHCIISSLKTLFILSQKDTTTPSNDNFLKQMMVMQIIKKFSYHDNFMFKFCI